MGTLLLAAHLADNTEMNELLGFMVLTGPLLLIVAWLPLCIWISMKVVRRFQRGGLRWVGGWLTFLVLFLVPFADEVVGPIYLSYLCATEARFKVYQTVELPREYWDEQGRAKFLNERGVLDMEMFGNRFEFRGVEESITDSFIKIGKRRHQLRDAATTKMLGEKITFRRYYGWLNRFSPAPNVAESCRKKEAAENRNYMLKIFVPPSPLSDPAP